jgi:hypothetical protein
MTTKTNVKAGGASSKQNNPVASGLRVRTPVKAGFNFTKITYN